MANIKTLLDKALPAASIELLRAAGELAASSTSRASEAYLVGGPARDALLGRDSGDLDIVAVGDGVAFARALADATGGRVIAESEFGTVKLSVGEMPMDVATARRETYPGPGELPEVEPSSLEEDLARRDYSVNAMAVDLAPHSWGDLIDLHGGHGDLMMRRLRVLHERSYIDDPTRILRGLRYEVRLGFKPEPRTLEYMSRDAGGLGDVSGARIIAELEKIFDEDGPAEIFRLAEERGVLAGIHPSLRISGRALQAMSEAPPRGDADRTPYLAALIGGSITESEVETLIRRLQPPLSWVQVLRGAAKFRDIASVLDQAHLNPSEIYYVLKPFPGAALKAHLATSPHTLRRERLETYLSRLQFVRPECTGDDLLGAGVPQGPLIGKLLEELLRARLDRAVRSKTDELTLVQRRLPMLLGRSEGR